MVELALLPNVEHRLEGITDTPDACNKYWYPEFAGWHGERYLKKLLRQILPMALYRTWEIFADHQAQGSDCYLGITRLAEIAGRATRTMEKNLASLCAKQLLVERAERKVFRREEDGTLQSRVVVVKDFRGLYALAHEYHEWTLADAYIAPDREVLSLLEHEPHLVTKLRRFENYRRLLYTRQPGPIILPREEDRWFTEYQPESAFYLSTSGEEEIQAIAEKKDAIPAKLSAKQLPKDLAEGSLKRRERKATLKTGERDSVDSVSSSSLLKKEENAAEREYPQKSQQRDEAEGQPTEAHGVSTPIGSVPWDEASPFQDGITFSQHEYHTGLPLTSASSDAQEVVGLQLADSFLAAIAGPFGDQSPKGTRTRLRACFQEAHLVDPAEIVMCLVRAYIVARDTHTIRAEHCHAETGRVNRMPLFCAMVPRLVEASRRGPWWESDWQCIEAEIASDCCLAQWWQRHQLPLTVVEETHLDVPETRVLLEADQEPTTPPASPRRKRLSQTDQAREERAAYARTVLRHLRRMAVPIQDASVLWEHVTCGNPLYHRPKGREVCALCFPDPEWPEEVLALLHSIVEHSDVAPSEGEGQNAKRTSHAPSAEEEMTSSEAFDPGWVDRDEAYAYAIRLLDTITDAGYVVEVFLELMGERYQVVVRGADGELVCENPEQIAYLMEQAQNGTL
ncbi:MAG TPA: hypothetical protein VFV38_16185 [Ktedonobacteraceae bacterium]|nr:hypothetical protein [Ktedonobacteraceae bacterium]